MITVNGTALSTLGFTAEDRRLPGLGGETASTVAIPGGIPLWTGARVEPAVLAVSGVLKAPATASPAADHAAALFQLDALALLLRGENVVRFDDYADREWVGRLQGGARADFLSPQWLQRAARCTLEWLCADPRARARVETTRTGSGALVLGTAPSPIRVAFTGAAGTVRVRAGGSGGAILTELVWAGASGAVVVDGETGRVTRGGANAIGGITAASTFPIADPASGANYLEVPAGAAVTYRRRWW